MKIKSGPVSLSNKKKSALPQSKLLKPKKLKPSNKMLNNQKKSEFNKKKLSLALEETGLTSKKPKPKKNNVKIAKHIQGLENMEGRTSLKTKVYKPNPDVLNKENEGANTSDVKDNIIKQLNLDKVTHAVAALLKLVKQDKNVLLALPETIFMEVECIKIPVCPTKQIRFKLPHPLVNDLSDVLLITADKKGAKIYPDKAVDYYTELLAKHDINFIQKIIPLRSLDMDYSQYSLRKKLVDQYDIILADAKIIKSLPSRLGKLILYKRKMPIPVNLNRNNLKYHLLNAISKTQMTVRGTGHKTVVQVGHTQMAEDEVAKNILAVTGHLDSFPGGWKNIRALDIKTPKSIALPIYYSFASPNTVETPEEKQDVKEPVVGELSTMMGTKVIVSADGTVRTRRIAEDKSLLDESKNDEILEEAKQYMQSRKTIRHDENSDSDEEAITSAMEKEIIQNYKKSKKDEKEENEEEEDEEGEESTDEDEPVAPILGQKRKKDQKKNQGTNESLNKKQKKVEQQGKLKDKAGKKEIQNPAQKKGLQKRGSRGGKKNKLNKHQRKEMLKKKKAGKK